MRQRLGEAGDGEIRRCGAIDDRGDDAGRNEGKGCQQADVTFALGFTLGNLGEGDNSTEPDVVDPSPGLDDCGEQSITALGCRKAASDQRPIPVSGSGVMLVAWIVPNCVAIGRPPA